MSSEMKPVSTSVSERGMGKRLRHRQTSLTYLPGASVKMREDEILARLWGCQPASAHQRKLRLPELVADVIRVRREAGHLESLADYLRPIEVAVAHHAPETAEAELMADRADATEDDCQALYRANPCEDTARTLLRKRALERQTSLDHDQRIAEQWGMAL